MRKLVDQYFGAIPRGPEPARKYPVEPPQTAPRTATLQMEVQIPVMVGGYHIPRAADPDMPALEVLAAILSAGESSRLNQRLVRKDHLAIAAGGVTETMEDPGLFIVYAAYLPDRTARRCRPRCPTRSRRVRDAPVDADELDKAKNQLAAGFVFGLETVDGIAQRSGQAQYVEGDWHRFIEGASRYLAVTAADVQRVAKKYLVDTNLTRVTLVPPGAPTAAAGHGRSAAGSQARELSALAAVWLRRGVRGCASAPPKPAAPAGSIEVQYEANPPAATPPAAAARSGRGATISSRRRRRPSRPRWRCPRSIASRCPTGCR